MGARSRRVRFASAASQALALSFLAACARPQSAHDVAWWYAHNAERNAKLAACVNDPGGAQHDPDCTNAEAALQRVQSDTFDKAYKAYQKRGY
jgi:hypothetical protein